MPADRPWRTAFFKQSVDCPVYLSKTGLAGDQPEDQSCHGGPEKAVCVYPASRYPYWEERLQRKLSPAAFGENFTIDGATEDDVCIGDIFEVGEVRVQISQPRSPCWKLARRWNEKKLSLYVQQTGFTGWYFRVLQQGHVTAGQALVLKERPYAQWTVMRTNEVRYRDKDDRASAAALARCDALSEGWRSKLLRRVKDGVEPDDHQRLFGVRADDDGVPKMSSS